MRRPSGKTPSGRPGAARPSEAEREAAISAVPGPRARIAAHQVISDVVASGHALDPRITTKEPAE